MTRLTIYLLTSVLIGLNGPFAFTERFERLEDCLTAKVYYHAKGQWAGGCRRSVEPQPTNDNERGKA